MNGQQYLWRYDYPGSKVFTYHQLVVPTDTTVVLKITSSDVIHSWWIPKLGGKADATPGYTNETWFKISKPGIYKGQCAELCGSGHADMRAQVQAVSAGRVPGLPRSARRPTSRTPQTALAAQRARRGEGRRGRT